MKDKINEKMFRNNYQQNIFKDKKSCLYNAFYLLTIYNMNKITITTKHFLILCLFFIFNMNDFAQNKAYKAGDNDRNLIKFGL